MRIQVRHLITKKVTEFESLDALCKKLSIRDSDLSINHQHVPFTDGIYQKYRCFWWEVTVFATLEDIIQQFQRPIPTTVVYLSPSLTRI